MGVIDLLNIQPHKVSKDLSGYITYIYGAPKTGKTTLAAQMPNHLLLAFERGYLALPGVVPYDIQSWTDMRQIYRELKKDEMREHFKCIIIDTVDYAADYCQKYICNQKGIDSLGDLGYGKGWTAFKEEFDEVFHGLTQLGYAVFFIAHDKESTITDPITGQDKIIVRPAVSDSSNKIIENMADIYGYAHTVKDNDGNKSVKLTVRDNSDTIRCGCRFKYIQPEIDLTYQALCDALNDAINKEAQATGNKFVTEEKVDKTSNLPKYDYDALMKEFETMVGDLMNKNQTYYAPRITSIVDKFLGKGKKVSDATPDQAEFIYLINDTIKDELMK